MEYTPTATEYRVQMRPVPGTVPELPVYFEHKTVVRKSSHEELLHWHNGIEIIQIKDGRIHCMVNDSDFLLSPGELCFINKEMLHRVYNEDVKTGELDVITINPQMLSHDKRLYNKYIAPVLQNPDFSHVQMDGRNGYANQITNLFNTIHELVVDRPEGYELDVIGSVYMIFRRLYLIYSENQNLPASYNSDIFLQRRMTSYIYEHYQDRLALDDIAGSAGVSRSKCTSLFHKFTAKTPIAFLNSYRLEMASKLLLTSDESISSIAHSCGIVEQSYFNRMFKKEYGCTPLEWRRQNGRSGAPA